MASATRQFIRDRAGGRCEYCGIREDEDAYYPFHIEHVIARQHGGADDASNLAWSCHFCNLNKGPNLSGIDPETLQIVRLYHPRQDEWTDHFEHQGPLIVGKTTSGRATIRVLKMNAAQRVQLRGAL